MHWPITDVISRNQNFGGIEISVGSSASVLSSRAQMPEACSQSVLSHADKFGLILMLNRGMDIIIMYAAACGALAALEAAAAAILIRHDCTILLCRTSLNLLDTVSSETSKCFSITLLPVPPFMLSEF